MARLSVMLGIGLVLVGCARGDRPARSATISLDWHVWTSAKSPIGPAPFSLEGSLFSTVEQPVPGVRTFNAVFDGKQFRGIAAFRGTNPGVSILEVSLHGQKDCLIVRAETKVPLTIKLENAGGKTLLWAYSNRKGKANHGIIELLPGSYEMQIQSHQSSK